MAYGNDTIHKTEIIILWPLFSAAKNGIVILYVMELFAFMHIVHKLRN